MRIFQLMTLSLAMATAAACTHLGGSDAPASDATKATLRVATYNVSLYTDRPGGLVEDLEAGSDQARRIAAVLQRVRPDVVLLNEFDYDPAHRAADLMQQRYLQQPQPGGGDALHYPYRYLAEVNTGVASGLDLDGDGQVGTEGRARGNDAWGYGVHPGQYGMLVLSMHPIDAGAVRTFRLLRWNAMPAAMRPVDPATGRPFHPDDVWRQLRLSSKSHWDVPIQWPHGTVHLLAAHPTPPVFDGPEDRNGRRNHDEIRLWSEYLSGGAQPWLCDDQGRCGGLAAGASFVVAGDLNADPLDGDSTANAIGQLLQHPRIDDSRPPRSEGAVQRAARHGLQRTGDPANHTGDFGPRVGTLRLDYVLPSRDLDVVDRGVFWPREGESGADQAEASDHRLVWIDIVP